MTTTTTPTAITEVDRADRIAAALALRRSGRTYPEISREFGCALSTAHGLVREGLAVVVDSLRVDGDFLLAQECERLDGLFAVAWDHAVGGVVRDPDTGDVVIDDKTKKPKRRHPDPRWMEKAVHVLGVKARLLGLDERKISVQVSGDVAVTPTDLGRLSPRELAMLELIMDKVSGKLPAHVVDVRHVVDVVATDAVLVEGVDSDTERDPPDR